MTVPVRTAPGARVEVATWRPAEVLELDGWSLGLSAGFTRRANSVVPWRSPASVAVALDTVEAEYADRGLPAIVRIDADAQPAGLDARLAARGYARVATTRVLVTDLPTPPPDAVEGAPGALGEPGTAVTCAQDPDEDWLAGWLDVKAPGRPVDRAVARRVLTGSPAVYLTARDAEGVAGVVRAAFAEEWAGLSCLMVAPRARRRGLARALSDAALREAGRRGAARAFLQVEADNAPAVALYERLGFVVADEYHYRERGAARGPAATGAPTP